MSVKVCDAEVLEDPSVFGDERYTPWQFRTTVSTVAGRTICRDTFNTWRYRLGIEADSDGCYGREEIVHLLGWLDFRAKTGGTTRQYLLWKKGVHNPAFL